MSTPNENTTVPETPIFDPFPEPNTMPSGWDLTGFTPEPAPATATPSEDNSEA